METEVINLIINAALYCTFAVIAIFKYKISYKTMPAIIWAISSIVSILYFTNPFRTTTVIFHDNISLIPLLYLFGLVLISFVPLLRFDDNKIYTIKINIPFFYLISSIIIALSLVPLYSNVKYFVENMFAADAFIDTYKDKMDMSSFKISFLSDFEERCMRWLKYFRGVIPILFFVSFSRIIPNNKFIIIGLGLAILNVTINFLNYSSRYALLTDMLYLLFIYLLFVKLKLFKVSVEKKVRGVLIFISSILLAGIVIVTLQRFVNNSGYSKGLDYALELYAGEGFCNFAGDLWNIRGTTDGENCFGSFIAKWNGNDEIGRNYLHLETMVHRRMNVFYTFIGDYYTDFGRYFTVIFVLFVAFMCLKLTTCKKNTSFGVLIFLCVHCKILVVGITYWTYLNFSFELIGSCLTAVIFFILNTNQMSNDLNRSCSLQRL